MSGKVVNLRTFRKQKERAARETEAAENRTRHGRTKAERRFEDSRRDAAEHAHDGRLLNVEAGQPDDEGPKPA